MGNMRVAIETCAICGAPITGLETRQRWNAMILCANCRRRLTSDAEAGSASAVHYQPNWVKDRLIRCAFAAIALLFPFQYWYAKTRAEPYPALILPGFGASGLGTDGRIHAESADLVVGLDDGSNHIVSMGTLFSEAPISHVASMASIGLRPKATAIPSDLWGDSNKYFLKSKVFPGLVVGTVNSAYWSGLPPDTSRWINRRIAELFPSHTATRAKVIWYADDFSLRTGQLARDRIYEVSVEIK